MRSDQHFERQNGRGGNFNHSRMMNGHNNHQQQNFNRSYRDFQHSNGNGHNYGRKFDQRGGYGGRGGYRGYPKDPNSKALPIKLQDGGNLNSDARSSTDKENRPDNCTHNQQTQ